MTFFRMKKSMRRRILKVLGLLFLALGIIFIFAYNYLLGSSFLCSVLIPNLADSCGFDASARKAEISLFGSSFIVEDLKLTKDGRTLLHIRDCELDWTWAKIFVGRIEVRAFKIRGAEIRLDSFAGSARSASTPSKTAKSDTLEGNSPAQSHPPDLDFMRYFSVLNLSARKVKLFFGEEAIGAKGQSIEIDFSSVNADRFEAGKKGILRSSGTLKAILADSSTMSAVFKSDLSFEFSEDFLPKLLDCELLLDRIEGKSAGLSLDKESIHLSSKILMPDWNKMRIGELIISQSDGAGKSKSKISIEGQLGFSPPMADLHLSADPIGPHICSAIMDLLSVEIPGEVSVTCDGKIMFEDGELKSFGTINARHELAGESPLSSVLSVVYDASAAPDRSLYSVSKLAASLSVNGSDCASVKLGSPLRFNSKDLKFTGNSEGIVPFDLKIDGLDLSLLRSFVKDESFSLEKGLLDLHLKASAETASSSSLLRASGDVQVRDAAFSVSSERVSGISCGVEFADLALDSAKKISLGKIAAKLSSGGFQQFKLVGSGLEHSFLDGNGRFRLDDLFLDGDLLKSLPAKFADGIPLEDFEIDSSLELEWKRFAAEFSYSGKIASHNLKFREILEYADFSKSDISLNFKGLGNSSGLRDLSVSLALDEFRCHRSFADLRLDAGVKKINFDSPFQIDISELNFEVEVDDCKCISGGVNSPFSLSFSDPKKILSPSMRVDLKIDRYPLKLMHGYFDPSDAFEALSGTASAKIFCLFGPSFNIDMATVDLDASAFEFKLCGTRNLIPSFKEKAKTAFDTWLKLNVLESSSRFENAQKMDVLHVETVAGFNFSVNTGEIECKFSGLDEKSLSVMPAEIRSYFSTIKRCDLGGSTAVFKYGADGLCLDAALKGKGLSLSDLPDKKDEADFALECSLSSRDSAIDLREYKLEASLAGAPMLTLSGIGRIEPENRKYILHFDSSQSNPSHLIEFFSGKKLENTLRSDPEKKTEAQPVGGSAVRPFWSENNLDIIADFKNVVLGEKENAELSFQLLSRESALELKNLSGRIGTSPLSGALKIALLEGANFSYALKLSFADLELGPLVNPYLDSKKPFEARVSDFKLDASSPSASRERPLKGVTGLLDANFEKISIPCNLREKSTMVNLILTPVEALSTIGKYIPEKYMPTELLAGAEFIGTILKGTENLKFKDAEMRVSADAGKLRVEECRLNGELIKFLLLKGTIYGEDGRLDISSETRLGKLSIPLKIKGTLFQPTPDYTMVLPDFLEMNAKNLLSVDNINDILNITKDTGKNAGEKTMDVINKILELNKKKGSDENPEGAKDQNSDKNESSDDIDVRDLIDLIKKKKKK